MFLDFNLNYIYEHIGKKDAFAETYTVQINPAGIKLYANNPTS